MAVEGSRRLDSRVRAVTTSHFILSARNFVCSYSSLLGSHFRVGLCGVVYLIDGVLSGADPFSDVYVDCEAESPDYDDDMSARPGACVFYLTLSLRN